MSALLDKLRNGSKARAGPPSAHVAEGSLLSHALQRAQAQRAAARNELAVPPPPEVDPPAASPPAADQDTAPHGGHGVAALLLAVVILVVVIAVWHASPSPMPGENSQQGLKLDHSLKNK